MLEKKKKETKCEVQKEVQAIDDANLESASGGITYTDYQFSQAQKYDRNPDAPLGWRPTKINMDRIVDSFNKRK